MKHVPILFALILLSAGASGGTEQTKSENGPEFTAYRVIPKYPEDARKRNVEGKVVVKLLVGTNGDVESASIVSSEPPGVFDEASLAATRQWKFLSKCGNRFAEPFEVLSPFEFRLEDKETDPAKVMLLPFTNNASQHLEAKKTVNGALVISRKSPCQR